MKPPDVKTGTHIDFDVENNDKDPKLKVGDYVQSKYKNIFPEVGTQDWFKEGFPIKKGKNAVPWA